MNSPGAGPREKIHDSHGWVLASVLGCRIVYLLGVSELGKEAFPGERGKTFKKSPAFIKEHRRRWWRIVRNQMDSKGKKLTFSELPLCARHITNSISFHYLKRSRRKREYHHQFHKWGNWDWESKQLVQVILTVGRWWWLDLRSGSEA